MLLQRFGNWYRGLSKGQRAVVLVGIVAIMEKPSSITVCPAARSSSLMRALMKCSLICLMLGIGSALSDAACTDIQVIEGAVIARIVMSCQEGMSKSQILDASTQRLKAHPSKASIVEVFASTSRDELERSVLARVQHPSGESSYDLVLDKLKSISRLPLHMSQLMVRVVKHGDSSKATVRLGQTQSGLFPGIESLQLSGVRDPQAVQGARDLKWLWIEEYSFGPKFSKGLPFVEAFFRTSEPPTCAVCSLAYESLRANPLPAMRRLDVRVRNDTFFDGKHFPLLYRFESDMLLPAHLREQTGLGRVRLPSVEWYYRGSREVVCWSGEPPSRRPMGCKAY
jgi:hypothetical protein